MENKQYKTWLPMFTGFYETIWQFDDARLLSFINEDRNEKNLFPVEWDIMDIDYKQYEEDISIKLCEVIKNYLENFIEDIIFDDINYPEEYNFCNNSIDCLITPKTGNIKEYIYKNKEKFVEYLKNNYTSYDGFIPMYSNNFLEWEADTNQFSDFSINKHYLGTILQFIYENEIDDDIDIYYDVTENIDGFEYLKNYDECMK